MISLLDMFWKVKVASLDLVENVKCQMWWNVNEISDSENLLQKNAYFCNIARSPKLLTQLP